MAKTYDVAAFQRTAGEAVQKMFIENVTNGRIITGTEKLAQRFILELMTEKGSMKFRPTRGTDFVVETRQGTLDSEVDVYSAFSLALLTIKNNLTSEDLATDPADEKLDTASINKIVISPGRFAISITIKTLAGSATTVVVPLVFDINPSGDN